MDQKKKITKFDEISRKTKLYKIWKNGQNLIKLDKIGPWKNLDKIRPNGIQIGKITQNLTKLNNIGQKQAKNKI